MGHFSTFSSSMRGSGIGYTLRRNYPRVKNNASAKQWPWSRRNAADRGFSCGVDGYCVAFATICSASVSVSSVCSIFFYAALLVPAYRGFHDQNIFKGCAFDVEIIVEKKKLISVFSGVILFYLNELNFSYLTMFLKCNKSNRTFRL